MVEYKKIIETKLINYNINLEIFEEESKDINILIIESKEEHKEKMPVLVVLAGYSHNSFRGTADILITPFSLKSGTGESKAFFPESLKALHTLKQKKM